MSVRFPLIAATFLALSVAPLGTTGCVPMAPITVVHVKPDAKSEEVVGDPLRVKRPPAEVYAAVRGGAYAIRNVSDWQKMWAGSNDQPAYPSTIEANEMLLVVATEDRSVAQLTVSRAVDAGEMVAVYIRQTRMGEGCVRRPDDRTSPAAAVTPRLDKPIKFFIEDQEGPSCGQPPKAEVGCRVAAQQSWSSKLTAKSGDVIECELSSIAQGKYELVDQMLALSDSPPGSNAKLRFSKGPTRATLSLDAFGVYAVRAEATDEAGRKGRATAIIEVQPKKTRDVQLQLTWMDVDAGDPLTPLPRVMLRVAQEGPRGQRCSSEVPVPGLCDAKTRGAYTYMRIPASRRKLPVSLLYLDERAQSGPSPCVNVWFNGERTGSTCDKDHRHAEDRWEVGTLDTTTGKIAPPKPPPDPKTPPPDPKGKPAKPATAAASSTPPAPPPPAKK